MVGDRRTGAACSFPKKIEVKTLREKKEERKRGSGEEREKK
jgi:hypothetical protein